MIETIFSVSHSLLLFCSFCSNSNKNVRTVSRLHMGGGASGLAQEARKPVDGSDLKDEAFEGVRAEICRLRGLLYKYSENLDADASDLCAHDTEEENREACMKEILYVREMIRMRTAGGGRRMREKSRSDSGLGDAGGSRRDLTVARGSSEAGESGESGMSNNEYTLGGEAGAVADRAEEEEHKHK